MPDEMATAQLIPPVLSSRVVTINHLTSKVTVQFNMWK